MKIIPLLTIIMTILVLGAGITYIAIRKKLMRGIKCMFIGKDGHTVIKRKAHSGGRIRHEDGSYVFAEKDVIKVGRHRWLVFFEGNPHALRLTYLEPPIMDASSYDAVLKMEGIKAMQMMDEDRRKHEILVLAMLFVQLIVVLITAYGVFRT